MHALLTTLLIAFPVLSPMPQDVVPDDKDSFEVHGGVRVVVADNATDADVKPLAALFEALGARLRVVRAATVDPGDENLIFWGVAGEHAAFDHRKLQRFAEFIEDYDPEGYCLHIDEDRVAIVGTTKTGALRGLQTLIQIARETGALWPRCDIRDQPAINTRGVVLTTPPTLADRRALLAAKCNLVLVDDPDLLNVGASPWSDLLGHTDTWNVATRAVLRPFQSTDDILAQHPEAAALISRTETLQLAGEDWVLLPDRHILLDADHPLEVSWRGQTLTPRVDYTLQEGDFAWPFDPASSPWMIRALPGGAVAAADTVTVQYTAGVPGAGLDPCASGVTAWLGDTIQRVADAGFDGVHVDNTGAPDQSATACLRNPGDALAAVVADLSSRAGLAPPWRAGRDWKQHEGLNPYTRYPTPVGPAVLSSDPFYLIHAARHGGISALAYTGMDDSLAHVMDMAWSPDRPPRAWPAGLNEFFHARLWQPTFDERLSAILDWVNMETVAGASPEILRDRWDNRYRSVERGLGDDTPELEATDAVMANVLDYLAAEYAWTEDRGDGPLRDVANVVQRQAELDPAFGEDRLDRILATIEDQGLFVPGSILFGQPVAYHRARGGTLYPAPVDIAYDDRAGASVATLDFGVAPGPLLRLDFESVGATSAELSWSADGMRYESAGTWEDPRGLRGPLFPSKSIVAAHWRLVLQGPGERVALRELRPWCRKETPTVRTSKLDRVPDVGEAGQVMKNRVLGFLNTEHRSFAKAGSTVAVVNMGESLLVHFVAHEPRLHAMVPGEEAFKCTLDLPSGRHDFTVHPNEDKAHTLDGVAQPGSRWSVYAVRGADSWEALVELPYETLGLTTSPASIRADFQRLRRNIESEDSAWAGYDGNLGTITF